MPRTRQSHHHDLHELERATHDPFLELRPDIIEIGWDACGEEFQVILYFYYNLILRALCLVFTPLSFAFLVKSCDCTLDLTLHVAAALHSVLLL